LLFGLELAKLQAPTSAPQTSTWIQLLQSLPTVEKYGWLEVETMVEVTP
jgi:hypothetical protein